jgi:hypothetical protein
MNTNKRGTEMPFPGVFFRAVRGHFLAFPHVSAFRIFEAGTCVKVIGYTFGAPIECGTIHLCRDFRIQSPSMSRLEYYRQDPYEHLPHRGGLVAWGITLMVFGIIAGLIAFVILGLSAVSFMGIIPSFPVQSSAGLLMGVAIYGFASVALIWLGIGSRSGRRWVRPLMISGSSIIAVGGLSSLAPMIAGIRAAIKNPITPTTMPAMPANIQWISIASGGCSVILLMMVLPLILLWFYGRRSVQATLDQMDPHPRWTDRCPLPVLAWSVACLFMGTGLLFLATRGILPFFMTVLTGVLANVVILSLATLYVVGGILCFRLSRLGWLMTFIATAVIAASYLTFAWIGDHNLYVYLMFEGMHLPKASLEMAERMSGESWLQAVVTYSFAVCYVLWLWNKFRTPVASPEFPPQATPDV